MIEEGDELPPGMVEADAPRVAEAPVRLAQDAQPGVAKAPFDGVRAAVRRSVVDEEDLEAAVRLREDALERLPDVAGGVMQTDRDADCGRRLGR